mmetsp:Transcript_57690/g.120617  ORF Transcript_57690/g.120617 Transcript_57690/m.120617 type:complete len:178 (+) Transcript_57690:635-1168(+)
MPTPSFIEERSIRSPLEHAACYLCDNHYPHVVSSSFCSMFRRIHWAELVTPNGTSWESLPSEVSLRRSVVIRVGGRIIILVRAIEWPKILSQVHGLGSSTEIEGRKFWAGDLKEQFQREDQTIRPCSRACFWFAASITWGCFLEAGLRSAPCCARCTSQQQRLNGIVLVSAPPKDVS